MNGDTLFVFGGHSVAKEGAEEIDIVHDDLWAFHFTEAKVILG